jgi:hypothetical protein
VDELRSNVGREMLFLSFEPYQWRFGGSASQCDSDPVSGCTISQHVGRDFGHDWSTAYGKAADGGSWKAEANRRRKTTSRMLEP